MPFQIVGRYVGQYKADLLSKRGSICVIGTRRMQAAEKSKRRMCYRRDHVYNDQGECSR